MNQQKLSSENLTFREARDSLRNFVAERDWHKYHTPRNLILALVGQVGQLSEIFQWRGQVPNNLEDFTEDEKIHVGQQIADILNYLIRFSDVCGIDLSKAFLDKQKKIRLKYPSNSKIEGVQLFNYYKKQKREQSNKTRESLIEQKASQIKEEINQDKV